MEPNELTVFVIRSTIVQVIKGDYLQNCSVGLLNQQILGKSLRNVVHKYYWILLANQIVPNWKKISKQYCDRKNTNINISTYILA